MSVTDIRPVKTALREKYKQWRRELPSEEKEAADRIIAQRVVKLWQYRENDTLLIYVSTAIEVDTGRLIEQAWQDGKRVAVPRCVPGTREMKFYYITDRTQLEPGTFGVLEPVPQRCEEMTNWERGLCVVPALSYDWQGFRLGYGKGYYDRFLSRFSGCMIGICYAACVQRSLPHGYYDKPVELLVTERYLRRTAGRKRGGKQSHDRGSGKTSERD